MSAQLAPQRGMASDSAAATRSAPATRSWSQLIMGLMGLWHGDPFDQRIQRTAVVLALILFAVVASGAGPWTVLLALALLAGAGALAGAWILMTTPHWK